MLAGVDLNFQFQNALCICLGCEVKNHVHGMSSMVALALPEPRQCVSDSIDCRANGFGRRLYQIDIFRVAQRTLEQ